jgi:hypothetical protein
MSWRPSKVARYILRSCSDPIAPYSAEFVQRFDLGGAELLSLSFEKLETLSNGSEEIIDALLALQGREALGRKLEVSNPPRLDEIFPALFLNFGEEFGGIESQTGATHERAAPDSLDMSSALFGMPNGDFSFDEGQMYSAANGTQDALPWTATPDIELLDSPQTSTTHAPLPLATSPPSPLPFSEAGTIPDNETSPEDHSYVPPLTLTPPPPGDLSALSRQHSITTSFETATNRSFDVLQEELESDNGIYDESDFEGNSTSDGEGNVEAFEAEYSEQVPESNDTSFYDASQSFHKRPSTHSPSDINDFNVGSPSASHATGSPFPPAMPGGLSFSDHHFASPKTHHARSVTLALHNNIPNDEDFSERGSDCGSSMTPSSLTTPADNQPGLPLLSDGYLTSPEEFELETANPDALQESPSMSFLSAESHLGSPLFRTSTLAADQEPGDLAEYLTDSSVASALENYFTMRGINPKDLMSSTLVPRLIISALDPTPREDLSPLILTSAVEPGQVLQVDYLHEGIYEPCTHGKYFQWNVHNEVPFIDSGYSEQISLPDQTQKVYADAEVSTEELDSEREIALLRRVEELEEEVSRLRIAQGSAKVSPLNWLANLLPFHST